jgi:hypothetical protein
MTAFAPNGVRARRSLRRCRCDAGSAAPRGFARRAAAVARWATAGDERLIQRLAAIAFLHDLGKANRGFQNKIYAASALAHSLPETAGHVCELWPLLSNPDLQSA